MNKLCKNCGQKEGKHYQDIVGMPLMCEPMGDKKFEEEKGCGKEMYLDDNPDSNIDWRFNMVNDIKQKVLKEVREEFCPGFKDNKEWISFREIEVEKVKKAIDLTLAEVGKIIDKLSFSIKDERLMDVCHVQELKKELGI